MTIDSSELDESIDLLNSVKEMRFDELKKICERYFGPGRNNGGSHYVFKTPWQGQPWLNIQKDGKDAKRYQIKQVGKCLEKLRGFDEQ